MNLNDSVYERLLRERIIFLGSAVDDPIANQICAQLLLLAAVLIRTHRRACGRADNIDLGTACGKLHRVCVLAITDPGALLCTKHMRLN